MSRSWYLNLTIQEFIEYLKHSYNITQTIYFMPNKNIENPHIEGPKIYINVQTIFFLLNIN